MKLLIVLTLIACSCAETLDRTYLPPESAATAGGSPGSLTAPGSGTGPGLATSPIGQPSGTTLGQPSGTTFGSGSPQVGPQIGSTQTGQLGIGQYTPQQYNQQQAGALPEADRLGFQQAGNNQGPTSSGQTGVPSSFDGIAQGPSSTLGGPIRGSSPVFSSQSQGPAGYPEQIQPERARASVDRNAEILRYDNQNDGETYAYSFETSNGISAEEYGVATNGVRAQGAFAYTGDDGQQYRVTYTADENGYRPQGDHLPTPPPIPEDILKSLEKNAQAAASGTQEGAYNPDEDTEVAINSQQFNGDYYGQGQPDQTASGYQPNQATPSQYSATGISPTGTANLGEQGSIPQNTAFGSLGTESGVGTSPNAQYSTLGSTAPGSTGFTRPSGGQGSISQYGPSSSPAISGAQSIPSQSSPSLQYNVPGASSATITGPSGPSISGSSLPGAQRFSQDSGYQYNMPGSSGPGRFGSQGPQVVIGQRPSSQYNTPDVTSSGSSRPVSKDSSSQSNPSIDSQYGALTEVSRGSRPITGSGSGIPGITSINSGTPSRFTQQSNQNSGYNYNNPADSTLSSPSKLGSQSYASQSRPQGTLSQLSQTPALQNNVDASSSGPQDLRPQSNQSPSSGYGGTGFPASNAVRPSANEGSQLQNNYSPQREQSRPGFNQRPQFGSSRPIVSGLQGATGQGNNDGYQYNQPQTQFNVPDSKGAFPRPSGTNLPSAGPVFTNQFNQAPNAPSQSSGSFNPTQALAPGYSGNSYSPSGSPTSPTSSINGFEYSKPSGSIDQGYPTGPATNAAPGALPQGSAGQYKPLGPTSTSSDSAFPRPDSSIAQYQPGQNAGTKSPAPVSAPYQYNRPGSQGPSGSAQTPFGTQAGNSLGSPGQNKPNQAAFGPLGQVSPGQVGYQSNNGPLSQVRPGQIESSSGFGPSAQNRPSQTGSQSSMRPSGQDRPTENFGGSRQPPSFSSEEGYKY